MSCRTYLLICTTWDLTGVTIGPISIDNLRPPSRYKYKMTTSSKTVCESGEGGGPSSEGITAEGEMSPGGVIQNMTKCRKVLAGENGGDPGEETAMIPKKCGGVGGSGLPNPAKPCGKDCKPPKDANGEDANKREGGPTEVTGDPAPQGDNRAAKNWCADQAGGFCNDANRNYVKELMGDWWTCGPDGRPQKEGPYPPNELDPPVVCSIAYNQAGAGNAEGKNTNANEMMPNPPEGIGDAGCTEAWVACGNATQGK